MAISFSSLSWSASLTSIYDQAGRIFEEQVMNDVGTDYTDPEAFNTAIWYIAEKVRDRGFSALQVMSIRDIASGIGNHLSAYLKAEKPGSVAPVILGFLVGASLGGIGLTAIFAPHLLAVFAMKGAAIVHAHPQLTAKMLIRAAQSVLEGQSPAEVARSVAISTGAAIATPLLQDWLAGLKIH
jgi:hypothetical protein